MKKASCLAACLTVLAVSQAFAAGSYLGNVEPPKDAKKVTAPVNAPAPVIQQGGDTIGTATVIPAIPYADAGTTVGYVDDYTPSCAFSAASDVVYTYYAATDQCVDIGLCSSSYDTIVHVYDSGLGLVACNDDNCGLNSLVEGVPLTAGETYIIIIDGFSSAAGDYVLEVTECPPPCVVACPPGAVLEGEPNCGIPDTYNGGCNSVPPVVSSLVCDDTGVTVCGTYGAAGGTRDTDWYEVVLDAPGTLTVCMTGEYPSAVAVLDAACPPFVFDFQVGPDCTPFCATSGPVPAGTYRIFAATNGFDGFPCVGDYVLEISGYNCPPVGVEAANWTNVKTLFR